MQIWYELRQIGERGYTLEELVEKVKPRVPIGYAWRRYVRERTTSGRRQNASGLRLAIQDTPGARASAVHYVVRNSVNGMVKRRSAIKRPDGRFAVGPRKPHSAFTDEQHDFDGSISRKHVADMQLMRVLTGPDGVLETIARRKERNSRANMPTIGVALANALERWAEAHMPTQGSGQT